MPPAKITDPWRVGPIRVRFVRGPREDGCVYWRAFIPNFEGSPPTRWCPRDDPEWSAELLRIARSGPRTEDVPADRMLILFGRFRAELEARRVAGEVKPQSVQAYAYALRYLTTGLADVATDALDVEVLRSYVRDRRGGAIRPDAIKWNRKTDAGRWAASPQTLAFEMQVLRMAWIWGRKKGIVDRPLELPKLPKPVGVRNKYTPTIEEVDRVIAELRQPWERAVVELLLNTGARISEIAALTWGQIDLPNGMMTLGVGQKTGGRDVPILEDVAAIFGELGPIASASTRIFPVTFYTVKMIGHSIVAACDRAKVPRWSPHGLRRLAVDRLYEKHSDVGVVAAILGQSPAVALRYYRQPRKEVLAAALRAAAMGTRRQGKVLTFRKAD